MNYKKIRTKAKQFESVTGLKVAEFDYLLCTFLSKWQNYHRIYSIEGKKRKKPLLNKAAKTRTLPSSAEKLFFILVYLKNYSLQEMLAASFDFSQSQASKWSKALRPLLHDSLKSLNMLAAREGQQVAGILEKLGEKKCFQDVTERLINRPADQDVQEEFYSGKKKNTYHKE